MERDDETGDIYRNLRAADQNHGASTWSAELMMPTGLRLVENVGADHHGDHIVVAEGFVDRANVPAVVGRVGDWERPTSRGETAWRARLRQGTTEYSVYARMGWWARAA